MAQTNLKKSCPESSYGRELRAKLDRDLRKLRTPPERKGPCALPAPLEPISKKLGGRRAKEKNVLTEIRKIQNRVKFGEVEEDVGFGDETEGLGMLMEDFGTSEDNVKSIDEHVSGSSTDDDSEIN